MRPVDTVSERSDVTELPKTASSVLDVTTLARHRGDLCDAIVDLTQRSHPSVHSHRISTSKVLLLESKGGSRTLAIP